MESLRTVLLAKSGYIFDFLIVIALLLYLIGILGILGFILFFKSSILATSSSASSLVITAAPKP